MKKIIFITFCVFALAACSRSTDQEAIYNRGDELESFESENGEGASEQQEQSTYWIDSDDPAAQLPVE